MTQWRCSLAAEYCSKWRQQCQILGFLGDEFHKEKLHFCWVAKLSARFLLALTKYIRLFTFFGVTISFNHFKTTSNKQLHFVQSNEFSLTCWTKTLLLWPQCLDKLIAEKVNIIWQIDNWVTAKLKTPYQHMLIDFSSGFYSWQLE